MEDVLIMKDNTENVIEGCKFVNNESENALIIVFNYSKLKLISCEFSGNKLSGNIWKLCCNER